MVVHMTKQGALKRSREFPIRKANPVSQRPTIDVNPYRFPFNSPSVLMYVFADNAGITAWCTDNSM